MDTYTLIHVVLSLIGIVSGLVVLVGMICFRPMKTLNYIFLFATLGTVATGFGFPYKGITPGIIIGIITAIALVVAMRARSTHRLKGIWSSIYAFTATVALYLNVFVLIVQLFMKVPS